MSNLDSTVTKASDVTPVEGHMNTLFENPSNKTGNDAPATCSQQDPLYRIGTAPRIQFDKRNEMIVQVKFKIYTEKEVEADHVIKVASRARRSAAASASFNLIESKMFNEGNVIELVKCLFGKSLNDFKAMCGDICEVYEPGLRHMVLMSDVAPRLKWMGQVGREKVFLVDYSTWQAFVDLLAKATKHKGSITIFTENEKVKAKKAAQTSAAKQYIASASGANAAEAQVGELTKELEAARKRIELHELTAQLFHEQSQRGTSGDGAILVCPWNPNFQYRLTWNGAWVWAKGVQAGMATRDIPPRTYEYLAIMKKSRVFHKAMQVDDRVKLRASHMDLNLSPTFNKSGGSSKSFFESPAKLLFPNASGSKRSATLAGVSEADMNKLNGDPVKKVKVETGSNASKGAGITIVLSSDPVSPSKIFASPKYKFPIKKEPASPVMIDISSDISSSPEQKIDLSQFGKKDFKVEAASSFSSLFGQGEKVFSSSDHQPSNFNNEQREKAHAAALEQFLVQCNVPKEDQTTRIILERAGVHSWTDLIPSLQMTESSLTTRGMHPCLASHLLSEAMDRMNGVKDESHAHPDEEEDLDDELIEEEDPQDEDEANRYSVGSPEF